MGPDSSQAPLSPEERRTAEAEELYRRFQAFPILADPMGSPFFQRIASEGGFLKTIPLLPHRSASAFLGVLLHWRNLELELRQPDPSALLICKIQRLRPSPSLGGSLLDLGSFLRFAVQQERGLEVIGGCVSKSESVGMGELPLPRLREFYTRLVGDLHEYRDYGAHWLFGLTRVPARYSNQRLWSRKDTGDPSCMPFRAGDDSPH